jgi:DNA repair exonuclease SbcCD ATPase subunit
MKIISLTLKNWMNISDASLSFSDGINVLSGANGQGKSSIFAAIAFLLADKTRDSTYKSFIKNGESFFNVKMEVDMGVNDIMTFDYTGKESTCNKEVTYQTATYRGEEANNFIKSSFDQHMLENVIFLLQDSIPITTMSPAERRDIFKKLFNSDFTETLNKIKADQKEIDTKIVSLSTERELLKTKTYMEFRIPDIDLSKLDQLNKELIESQNSEQDQIRFKVYADKLRDLNSRRDELSNLAKSKEKINASIDQVSQKILITQNEEISQQQQRETKKNFLETQKKEFQEIKSNSALNNFDAQIEEKTKRKNQIVQDLIEAKTSYQINLGYLTTHKKGLCPSCGQICLPENIEKYEKIVKEKEGVIASIEKEKKDIETAIIALAQKKEEYLSSIRTKEKELSTLNSDIALLSSKIENLTVQKANFEKEKERLVLQLNEYQTAQITLLTKISELEEWVNSNKIEIKENTSRPKQDIQKEIDEISRQIQENAIHEKINVKSAEEKKQDSVKITQLSEQIGNLTISSKKLTAVQDVFTNSFPSFINIKACRLLEDHMNDFFSSTKDGFKTSLQQDKKGINFYYKARSEPKWNPIRMTSGFESDLFSLCFKVSVAYSYGADFIILDEPDGAGDDEHSDKLFDSIINLGGFKQIFVITHKESALQLLLDNGAHGYVVKEGVFESR